MSAPKDPIMLLSYVNTKLRDFYSSLDALCDDLDLDKNEIVNTLTAAGYRYNSDRNQFV